MAPHSVRQIVFFRPGAVGDFVFALPCLATLKRRFPDTRLSYIGQAWHRDFLTGRPGPVDEVLVLPDCEGINAPATDGSALARFIAQLRERPIDIALQAFGGGRFSNPLVRMLGARLCIGWQAEDASPLDIMRPFHGLQNRRLQLLELAALAGADVHCSAMLAPGIDITAADLQASFHAVPDHEKPLALLQPGASDPRRRWPAERFARVGDWLASQGMRIAVNGTAGERDTVRAVISAMHSAAIDLSDRLTLNGLCGLLRRAALLISNDTGPLHLATEIGAPAVGIYWLSNLVESMPLRQSFHRAAWATSTRCGVCGEDNFHQRCAHQQSFVSEVGVNEVIRLAETLLTSATLDHGS